MPSPEKKKNLQKSSHMYHKIFGVNKHCKFDFTDLPKPSSFQYALKLITACEEQHVMLKIYQDK